MSSDDIYKPPESLLEEEASSDTNKPGTLIIVFTVLLSLPLMATQFFAQYALTGLPGGIGGSIGALFPAFVIVLFFQIGKRFRNSKSRWKIYMWSQVVFLLGQIPTMLILLGANV
jgi:hypothetical protein